MYLRQRTVSSIVFSGETRIVLFCFSLNIPLTDATNRCNKLDMCLSVYRCICVKKKNQLDVTEWFIALIICSTCFGHFYAHHQQLETIRVLLPPIVCSAWLLVVEDQVQGSRLAMRPGRALLHAVQHPSS